MWRNGGQSAAADDPFYVYAMLWTFYHYAPYIAYETYFNAMADQHLLCPSTVFPRAAAIYKLVWNRARPEVDTAPLLAREKRPRDAAPSACSAVNRPPNGRDLVRKAGR